MKRKSAWLSFAACALMGAHPVKAAAAKTTAAESPQIQAAVDFSSVQMIALKETGNVAFFDNSTGTLYIYDPTVSKCLAVKKLNVLGQPIQEIT